MKDSDLIYGIMASLGKKEYSIAYLIHLMNPFSISDSSLRTTLSRMVERGVLQSRKEGRKAFYTFARKGSRIGTNVSMSFRNPDWVDWNGNWWGFLYSVPASDKALRHKIRTKLSAYRFVSLYAGCWIRPMRDSEKIEEKLAEIITLGHGHLTTMNFTEPLKPEKVSSLWKIEEINSDFTRGINLINQSFEELGNAEDSLAFKLKILRGNEIVQILFRDPLLPGLFLPEDWKGDELRKKFREWEGEVGKKSSSFSNKEI